MKRVLIGHVGVDSGSLMIGDPCYLDGGFDYDEWVDSVDFEKYVFPGPSDYAKPGEGSTVAFPTYFGDGTYPVYAEQDSGGNLRVIIELEGEPDEDYDHDSNIY